MEIILKTINDIEEEIFYCENVRVAFRVSPDTKLPGDISKYDFERCLKGNNTIKQFMQSRLKPYIEYLKGISNIENISDLDIVVVVNGYGNDANLTDSMEDVRLSYKHDRRYKN